MSLSYIRNYYKVPAYRGQKVIVYDGETGTIVGAKGPHLRIKLQDGKIWSYHPTWEMTYLLDKNSAKVFSDRAE